MLDGLDDIDWRSMQHAYGAAEDVPALIRALLSDDGEERQEAVYELYSNIWHQGTIYEATPSAVPFLIELLKSPETPDRDTVAHLLMLISAGSGYFEVHVREGQDNSSYLEILADWGTTLSDQLANERALNERVRDACEGILDLLLPYLNHEVPDYRGTAAHMLYKNRHRRPEFTAMLTEAHESEIDPDTKDEMARLIEQLK